MFDSSSRIPSLPPADGQAEFAASHDLKPVDAPVLTGVCCAAWRAHAVLEDACARLLPPCAACRRQRPSLRGGARPSQLDLLLPLLLQAWR